MSATDELRRLLDERGVVWTCHGYENHTWWDEWHAEERPFVNGSYVKIEGVLMPEEAIAATLGRGECRIEHDQEESESISHSPEDTWAYRCSGCLSTFRYDRGIKPNFCPECGRKVVNE